MSEELVSNCTICRDEWPSVKPEAERMSDGVYFHFAKCDNLPAVQCADQAFSRLGAAEAQIRELARALQALVEASVEEFGPSRYNTEMNRARALLSRVPPELL